MGAGNGQGVKKHHGRRRQPSHSRADRFAASMDVEVSGHVLHHHAAESDILGMTCLFLKQMIILYALW